jgi:flotillin
MIETLIDSFVPLAVLVLLGHVSYELFKYIMSLQVSGKANQWVVIVNNGKMKQAGIGLSCMVSPGDEVAIFPSKVNKIVFSTQQVTSEMSGLEVSAMICWTVNREAEGPLRAYINLGKDLERATPVKSNELITQMASAIVRSRIANSTMDEILKNRQALRVAIRDEMSVITKGWGVWLETIEITDVKILSGSLFTDLQTTFREDQNKAATILKLDVETKLAKEKATYNLVQQKRDLDQSLVN